MDEPSVWQHLPIQYSPADRSMCPVCSHPTGDCKGEVNFGGMIEFKPAKKKDPAATFSVPRRVYEVREINGKTSRLLLYSIGDRIRPDEAIKLGLLGP